MAKLGDLDANIWYIWNYLLQWQRFVILIHDVIVTYLLYGQM